MKSKCRKCGEDIVRNGKYWYGEDHYAMCMNSKYPSLHEPIGDIEKVETLMVKYEK